MSKLAIGLFMVIFCIGCSFAGAVCAIAKSNNIDVD